MIHLPYSCFLLYIIALVCTEGFKCMFVHWSVESFRGKKKKPCICSLLLPQELIGAKNLDFSVSGTDKPTGARKCY